MRFTVGLADLLGMLRLPLVLVLAIFLLNGCALYDQRETVAYGHKGRPVPEDAVDSIQPQITTRTWILENLGEPDRISAGPNQTEIFTYRFERSLTTRTRIFLLFSSRKTVVEEKHIFVHFVGDIVHKFWRDYELPALSESSFNTEAKPADVAVHTDEDEKKIADSGVGTVNTVVFDTAAAEVIAVEAKISSAALPQASQSLSQPALQQINQQTSQANTSPRPVWAAPLDSASNGVEHY